MAGLPLFVGRKEDEVEYFKNEIQNILKTALNSIKLKENGVYVQASTLGSLEALLEFLKTSNIPVSTPFFSKRSSIDIVPLVCRYQYWSCSSKGYHSSINSTRTRATVKCFL